MRRLICTRSRAGRIDASAKGKNPPTENKKPARKKKAAKPPRGAKMRERCDSSVGTRSTANVLHFRDAKRSRRRGCKMPVKRRASATVALRRRCGAGGRIRTADLFITSESLCLLSHTSLPCFRIISNRRRKCNRFKAFCEEGRMRGQFKSRFIKRIHHIIIIPHGCTRSARARARVDFAKKFSAICRKLLTFGRQKNILLAVGAIEC